MKHSYPFIAAATTLAAATKGRLYCSVRWIETNGFSIIIG